MDSIGFKDKVFIITRQKLIDGDDSIILIHRTDNSSFAYSRISEEEFNNNDYIGFINLLNLKCEQMKKSHIAYKGEL